MATLPIKFNWGTADKNQNPALTRQLDDSYFNIAQVVNSKPSTYVTSGANPPSSSPFNINFNIGDIYIRTDNDTKWMMTSRTSDIAVTWSSF